MLVTQLDAGLESLEMFCTSEICTYAETEASSNISECTNTQACLMFVHTLVSTSVPATYPRLDVKEGGNLARERILDLSVFTAFAPVV